MQHRTFNFFFLDRDGVINTNAFVNTPRDFEFLPKSLDALQRLNELGKKVCIATNQGGVEAGHITRETLREIHMKMCASVMEAGGRIDKIYYCPHLKTECECRKPKPGMLLQGLKDFNLQDAKDKCCFVGDWQTDWQAAIAAGIQPIAVTSGREWESEQGEFIIEHGIPAYPTLYDAVLALIGGIW